MIGVQCKFCEKHRPCIVHKAEWQQRSPVHGPRSFAKLCRVKQRPRAFLRIVKSAAGVECTIRNRKGFVIYAAKMSRKDWHSVREQINQVYLFVEVEVQEEAA